MSDSEEEPQGRPRLIKIPEKKAAVLKKKKMRSKNLGAKLKIKTLKLSNLRPLLLLLSQ